MFNHQSSGFYFEYKKQSVESFLSFLRTFFPCCKDRDSEMKLKCMCREMRMVKLLKPQKGSLLYCWVNHLQLMMMLCIHIHFTMSIYITVAVTPAIYLFQTWKIKSLTLQFKILNLEIFASYHLIGLLP